MLALIWAVVIVCVSLCVCAPRPVPPSAALDDDEEALPVKITFKRKGDGVKRTGGALANREKRRGIGL